MFSQTSTTGRMRRIGPTGTRQGIRCPVWSNRPCYRPRDQHDWVREKSTEMPTPRITIFKLNDHNSRRSGHRNRNCWSGNYLYPVSLQRKIIIAVIFIMSFFCPAQELVPNNLAKSKCKLTLLFNWWSSITFSSRPIAGLWPSFNAYNTSSLENVILAHQSI